jgi:nucleoside-specific outer membrane channel protein Tsx
MNRLLGSALALVLLAAAPTARAGGFSTTNVQLLQGYGFDNILDANFESPEGFDDGLKTTFTLNQFSTWEHGDSFFFADLTRGDIVDFGGEKKQYTDAYAEWHPRLFVNSFGAPKKEPLLGFIRNWGLAGEVNQGKSFYAYMGGLGLDLQVPGFAVLGVNAYYRYDNFNDHGWQVSPFWTVPFSIGKVPFVFTGFLDVNGLSNDADENGWELWSQPELLVDVLAPFGGKAGKLHAGVEWWLHMQDIGEFEETSSVPQVMVQWTVF